MVFTKETEWNKLPIILKLGLAESIAKKGTSGDGASGATGFFALFKEWDEIRDKDVVPLL